jgi:hypothetical protein
MKREKEKKVKEKVIPGRNETPERRCGSLDRT